MRRILGQYLYPSGCLHFDDIKHKTAFIKNVASGEVLLLLFCSIMFFKCKILNETIIVKIMANDLLS